MLQIIIEESHIFNLKLYNKSNRHIHKMGKIATLYITIIYIYSNYLSQNSVLLCAIFHLL